MIDASIKKVIILGTAVVKLAGLSDFECAGAQDDYFLD